MNIQNEIFNLHTVATALLLRELSPMTKQYLEMQMIEISNAMAKQMRILTIYSDIGDPETVRFVWASLSPKHCNMVPLHSYHPPKEAIETVQRRAIAFCTAADVAMLALKNIDVCQH